MFLPKKRKSDLYEVMDVLLYSISMGGGILLQCIHMSDHHIVYFKYLTILSVSYTSIKLGKRRKFMMKNLLHGGRTRVLERMSGTENAHLCSCNVFASFFPSSLKKHVNKTT